MLELIDTETGDTVAWRVAGKITEDDMELALNALRATIERKGYVNIYQEIQGFGGVEWDAIEEKMKFLREFGVSHFRRIAVVTDKRWMQTVIGWEDRMFRRFEMRAFSTDERAGARNFLAYGGDDGRGNDGRGDDAATAVS